MDSFVLIYGSPEYFTSILFNLELYISPDAITLLKKSGWKIINQKMQNIKTGKLLSFQVITNKNKMEKLLLIWKDKLKKITLAYSQLKKTLFTIK